MTHEWYQAYLAEVGREIDNASSQLHETTNWSIGVVIAAFSAVAVASEPYPTRWTLAAVAVAWILIVRFFVRSCIAFSYLARWNRIHRAIVQVQLLADEKEKEVYQQHLVEAIEIYHVQWKSSTPLPRLLRSNLKLGYLQLFGLTMAMLLYGLVNSDWCDWVTWAIACIVLADLTFEMWIFPHRTYLEYKPLKRPLHSK